MLLTMLPFCMTVTPPTGLALLRAVLTAAGRASWIRDLNAEVYERSPEQQRHLWQPQSMLEVTNARRFQQLLPDVEWMVEHCVRRLLASPHRVIGFSLFVSNIRITKLVVQRLLAQDPQRRIVFGGPSTSVPGEREVLGPGLCDAWVFGEGEEVLPLLLQQLDREDRSPLPGVLFGREVDPVPLVPEPRPLTVADLNRLPWADYSPFDLFKYTALDRYRIPSVPIVDSRGCINRCAFCNDGALSRRYRFRDGADICAEMVQLHRQLKVRSFIFSDLVLNGNLDNLERLADALLAEGVQLHWSGQAVARGDMSSALWRKLQRAGLWRVTFGVETGSLAVRRRMNKGAPYIDPDVAVRRCSEAGIEAGINLMVGFPGETEAEFQQTIDFVARNRDYIHDVENIHPFIVKPLSVVGCHPERYGIRAVGEAGVDHGLQWEGDDGSTYPMRQQRMRQLSDALDRLGVHHDRHRVNLLETD